MLLDSFSSICISRFAIFLKVSSDLFCLSSCLFSNDLYYLTAEKFEEGWFIDGLGVRNLEEPLKLDRAVDEGLLEKKIERKGGSPLSNTETKALFIFKFISKFFS